MLPNSFYFGLLLGLVTAKTSGSDTPGEEMATLINDYRQDSGLTRIAFSSTLMRVGSEHVANSVYAKQNNLQYYADGSCNMHSWDAYPGKSYSTCCYTSDHAEAACMWNKPKEISTSDLTQYYNSAGYEISAGGYGSMEGALNGWKGSSGHNNVIINQDIWASSTWRALGCGADVGQYYHCWFATLEDPNTYSSTVTTEEPTEDPSGGGGSNNSDDTAFVVSVTAISVLIVIVAVAFGFRYYWKQQQDAKTERSNVQSGTQLAGASANTAARAPPPKPRSKRPPAPRAVGGADTRAPPPSHLNTTGQRLW